MNQPKTNDRRVKNRLKVEGNEMVTLGQQIRMIRELRGMSKAEAARLTGCDQGRITKIENGFMEGISFRMVHIYMKTLYATLIAVPVPFPSFINHEAHRIEPYIPEYRPMEHNVFRDPIVDEDPDEPVIRN